MNSLQNDLLKINVKSKGAELSSITSVKNNTEFIWQANPDVWGSHAPNLFPVIGSMKNDSYYYNNQLYTMTKHGFIRKSDDFTTKQLSENEIVFSLKSNSHFYKMYPFKFQLDITYKLIKNKLVINHKITNLDTKTMLFSLGGHPAFNCPLYENEAYTDYVLEFEKPETSESYLLNMNSGLVTYKTKSVFDNGNLIQLRGDLFNEDALIFKQINSRKVTLKHKKKGPILSVAFKDFKFLGIWAKPNAPYVCIEPWLGIADSETTNQKIEEKEGIISLKANSTFNAAYTIEIEHSHLA
ncbi:aldose 1-epimerase family protein [Winogradskyella sp. PE311]|uniref:aldose 1-epimerase family protein n=1 Tax=Winogradskyella sp. PE311 TaxID=3366943 RepID=UPI00397FD554